MKDNQLRICLDDKDLKRLDFICRVRGITRSDAIREGIALEYEATMNEPRFENRNNIYARRRKGLTADEAFEEWFTAIQEKWEEAEEDLWRKECEEEFENQIAEERAERICEAGGRWTERDEEIFRESIEDFRERFDAQAEERFADYIYDKLADFKYKMREKWDDMMAE